MLRKIEHSFGSSGIELFELRGKTVIGWWKSLLTDDSFWIRHSFFII